MVHFYVEEIDYQYLEVFFMFQEVEAQIVHLPLTSHHGIVIVVEFIFQHENSTIVFQSTIHFGLSRRRRDLVLDRKLTCYSTAKIFIRKGG